MPGEDPERIGPYLLRARLGAGGMGRVYLGESAGRRKVAIKVMRPELVAKDPSFRARFRREVEAAAAVGGHYTAHIVMSDGDADPPWYASSFINAPGLDVVVEHGGSPLDVPAATSLGAGLAEALLAVHTVGLVHRDLKPSNVLMADDGPRVIDFGIARIMENGTPLTATPAGTFLGTVGYLSPEQVRGRGVGPASDVFSFGALLVFATTGRTPFGEGTIETVLYRTLHEEPDLEGVPAELRPVVYACLDKVPGRRPTVETLLEHFGDLATVADRRGAHRPPAPPRRTLVDPAHAREPGGRRPEAAAAPLPPGEPGSGRRAPLPAGQAPAAAADGPSAVDQPWAPVWVAAISLGVLTYGQLWLLSPMWWQPAAVIAAVVTLLGAFAFRAAQLEFWIDEEVVAGLICLLLALACGIVAIVELSHTNLLWWAVVLIAIGVVLALAFVSLLFMTEIVTEPFAASVTTVGFASGCLAAALMSWSVGITPWLSLPLAFAVWFATARGLDRILSIGYRRPAGVGGNGS